MAHRCGVFAVDRVAVHKSARQMLLLSGDSVLRSYRVALGREPTGPKQREGDGRTPEGEYRIAGRNPDSRFHLSLRISYPNDADLAAARAAGVEPGGDIMIHGLPGDGAPCPHPADWTEGCIAVTNLEMDEIWSMVRDGTPVRIDP